LKISIVIPTHSRAETLRNAIDSVIALHDAAEYEFVIVDNNSTDHTRQVVESYAPVAKYVFEGNTSFSRARKTGADHSTGDVLLYLDDDVLVRPGALDNIVDVFSRYPDCGVIAGRIDPKYTQVPPSWTMECQSSFNGWSLFNPETYGFLHSDFQEVPSAAGPMMAIRRAAYDLVGGFPPDTIGVESNRGPKSFNKLYIGPGDYGLCLKIRDAGFKVYYSSAISVFHVIPPMRFSVSFWRSRVIGEGYAQAISARSFFHLKGRKAYAAWLRCQVSFFRFEQQLVARLEKSSSAPAPSDPNRVFPDELWALYYKAYLDMDYVLRRHPGLCAFLWEIGDQGVSSENYDAVMGRLPQEYKELVSNELVFDSTPLDSLSMYEKVVKGKGYYGKNISMFFRSGLSRAILMYVVDSIAQLKGSFRPRAQ